MAAPRSVVLRAWALFPSIESTLLRSAGDYHIDNLVNNIEDSDIIQVFLGNDAPESETAVAAVAEDMASNIQISKCQTQLNLLIPPIPTIIAPSCAMMLKKTYLQGGNRQRPSYKNLT
ncbi:hypothetical protein FQN52_004789 [Onygenales sp. PD_12]|nr:hypothetical protein FQN52_004789 [Onygenales sp. PD_12]